MGRIRTIKPDFHTSEDLSSLPAEAHLLASGLLCYADDEGYFDANPKLVRAAVFPTRDLDNPIEDLLQLLIEVEYIKVYLVKSKHIGHVVTFTTHQRVNRPTPSRLKPQCALTANSLPEGKGMEVGKEEEVSVISPEMVTQGVLYELSLSGRDLSVSLDQVCRAELKKGRDATELRDELIDAWKDYENSKPRLAWTGGPDKFFGGGAWRNKPGWPWKPGESPPIRKSNGENKALLAIKEREEAVRRERGI